MSLTFNLSKKWILLSVLAAFAFLGIRSTNVFAGTNASADGTATITVHVLESGADTPEQDTPTLDPDPEEYIEPEIDDDTPEPIDVDPDEEGPDEDRDIEPETPDESNSEDESSASGVIAPNTGENTDPGMFDGKSLSVGFFATGAIVIFVIILGAITFAWRKNKAKLMFGRNKYRSLGFNDKKNNWSRLFSWRKAAIGMAVLGGVLTIAGLSMSKIEQPEDVSAVSFTYPYTISTTDGKNYDVYVRRGESAEAAFAVRTITDNLTGYTLGIATANQDLTGTSGTHISMVNDGTTIENFANNTWGFSVDGASYGKLPEGHGSGKIAYQTKGSSPIGHSIVVHFATKIASDMPLGDYTTTLYLNATTNPVHKILTFANGNVAKITRVSDSSQITKSAKVLLGEELKINVAADASGIMQTPTVNNSTVSNNSIFTVANDVEVGTRDDSVHFLKNTVGSDNESIGDAILIKSQGKYWLVDTGRPESQVGNPNAHTIETYLNSLGIKRLDYVLLTHAHSDHMGSVNYLVSKGFINNKTTVYMRGCEATQSFGDDGSTPSTVTKDFCNKKIVAMNKANANVVDFYNHETERAGIQTNGITFGNFKIKLFNIDRDSSTGRINYNKYRENLNSIGMKVTHTPSNKTAFLAADWEWGVEDKYGSAIGKVDILKAGHHGIRTSNTYEFIKALNPKTVLVTSQNLANSDGQPNRQPAAWAYVEQNKGSVYFTGDSNGEAVAISFGNNNYEIKKGQAHSTLADANTDSSPRQAGPYTMQWGGGLTRWAYPANKDGSGGDVAYRSYKANYYVYVYKSTSSAGNIISYIDRCIDGYTYKFSSSFGDGVANGRTAGCSSQ